MPAQAQKATLVATNTYVDMTGVRTVARQIVALGPWDSDQADVPLKGGSLFSMVASVPMRLTGLVASLGGRDITLLNAGPGAITLPHESVASKAANRFFSASGADVIVQPNDFVTSFYDGGISRWRIRGAGGGGGATFVWGIFPAGAIDNVNAVYTLPSAPNPPQSLMLFRDGMFQTQGLGGDYTLAGNVITMNPGSILMIGSSLVASYQLT